MTYAHDPVYQSVVILRDPASLRMLCFVSGEEGVGRP